MGKRPPHPQYACFHQAHISRIAKLTNHFS
jgi:hypothetical protein